MENKVEVKIEYKDGINLEYVNGAFGGVSAKGEFVMHFFCETFNNPNKSEISVDQNVTDEKFIETDERVVKHVKASVIMTVDTARSIYDWIGNNLGLETKVEEE